MGVWSTDRALRGALEKPAPTPGQSAVTQSSDTYGKDEHHGLARKKPEIWELQVGQE